MTSYLRTRIQAHNPATANTEPLPALQNDPGRNTLPATVYDLDSQYHGLDLDWALED